MHLSIRKALIIGIPALGALVLGLIFALAPAFNNPSSSASAATACTANGSHLVPWKGGRWFLSGVNVPWQNGGYGADFATIEEWGQHTYNSAATNQMFTALQASGVNTVRWWIFADGRGAPEFGASSGGAVTGLDAATLASMEDAIKLAAQHNIYIVFNLWSFDMLNADSTASARGEHSGGHRDLIVDAAKRSSFINNALLPMLARPIAGTSYTIGTHPNVLGWDIFNEPEFSITDLGAVEANVAQPVTLAEMQRFIAEISGAIHRNSNQLTTVGSAAMKWNSDVSIGATGNVWKDARLTPYDAQGYLDFYQIHYYSWMNGDGVSWSYAPTTISWATAGFDKPTVIGELPANASGTGFTSAGLLNKLHSNCYAGAWGWSYGGVDGAGTWSDISAALSAFANANPSEVAISAGGGTQPTATAIPPTATPKPATATPVPPTATPIGPTATPKPATATPVPPTATVVPPSTGGTKTIFTDSLAVGWLNWSWDSTVSLASTLKQKVGATSVSVTFKAAWAGFYLHNNTPVSTKGYTKVRFWAHGGNGGQRLTVWTRDGSGKLSPQIRRPALTNAWVLVEIPLSQLGNPTSLSELAIQDASGKVQPTFYIDQIELAP